MTIDVIDTSLHSATIPTTYTGPGTVVGNAYTSGGVTEMASVYFTSDGNATTVLLGFRPVYIKVYNLTDGLIWEWMRNMPAADSIKTTMSAPTIALDTGSAINPTELAVSGGGNWQAALSATLCGTSKALYMLAFG